MSGWRGAFAGVLATLVLFAAIDATIWYVMYGVGFGMKEITYFPIFPLWLVVGAVAAVIWARLWRAHPIAITTTTVACFFLSVPFTGLIYFVGAWGCSDGGGCHGVLAP